MISLALLAALAWPVQAQDGKDWGKRERLKEDGAHARADAVTCPVCRGQCERAVYDAPVEQELDTDFKVVKASFNVYPYVFMTCPKCLYSTYSWQFHKALTDEQRKAVADTLKVAYKEYPDYWSVPISVTLQAALLTHQALKSPEGTFYEIYVLGSYLARDAGTAAAEREMQRRAVEKLVVAIEKDEAYQRAKMRYMAAELYRRLEQYKEALEWFSRARRDADEDLLRLIGRQELATRDAIDRQKKPKK